MWNCSRDPTSAKTRDGDLHRGGKRLFYSNSKKAEHKARARAYSAAMERVYQTESDDTSGRFFFFALSRLAAEPNNDTTVAIASRRERSGEAVA